VRYQGKITKWVDDKGFGFITPSDNGQQVFVHISGFKKKEQPPVIGEFVSYEIATDIKKGPQAYNVLYLNRPPIRTSLNRSVRASYKNNSSNSLSTWVLVLAVLFIGAYVYKNVDLFKLHQVGEPSPVVESVQESPIIKSQNFQCSGKTRCSEMSSCDEAMFYLNNCPGTITDGDGDGIPCEDQWCGH
jgi:cold shock CspA family protein